MDGKESSGFTRRRAAPQMIPKGFLRTVLMGDPLKRHRPVLWYRFPASMTPLDNHYAPPFVYLTSMKYMVTFYDEVLL